MKLWKRKWVIDTFPIHIKKSWSSDWDFFMSIFKGYRSRLFFTLISIDVRVNIILLLFNCICYIISIMFN